MNLEKEIHWYLGVGRGSWGRWVGTGCWGRKAKHCQNEKSTYEWIISRKLVI